MVVAGKNEKERGITLRSSSLASLSENIVMTTNVNPNSTLFRFINFSSALHFIKMIHGCFLDRLVCPVAC